MTDYATVDPRSAPEIEAALQRLGLGRLDGPAVSPGGRSDNWLFTTTTGRRVFAKRLDRLADGSLDAFTRSLAHAAADVPVRAPALLGSDADAGLLLFEGLDGAESGVEVALARRFTPEAGAEVGRQVARLHSAGPVDVDDQPSIMPPVDWFEAIPWHAVQQMNGAQLEAWRLLQDDAALAGAVARLRALEAAAPRVPIHADLRLDQVLLGPDGTVHLCDWESFRLGDPARDVGAFVGEWIYHSVFRIFTDEEPDWTDADRALDHDDVLRRGDENLTANAVHVRAFWDGYTAVRPIDDAERHRAFGFAGWHVVDRFLAASEAQTHLHPVAKAAAGIGRAVLLDPGTVASLLGDADRAVEPVAAGAGA